jgi:hypothetical protein
MKSMLKTQRTAIHKKIVELLLALEPNIEDSRPDLLAYHCELAGLLEKAGAYYIQAGWRSNYHAVYQDSCEQFRNALRLAATLPQGKARDVVELRALRGVGLTMGNIEGHGSANFGAANLRALELCDLVGQPLEFLGINFGISGHQLRHFRLSILSKRCLRRSEDSGASVEVGPIAGRYTRMHSW